VLPKQIRLTAADAERLLLKAGFALARSKGSHRIYFKAAVGMVIPFHPGKILHPKIIKQLERAIENAM
jgi:predicted RNA binding protein YcfA (HicA-like mRNA interferase family)